MVQQLLLRRLLNDWDVVHFVGVYCPLWAATGSKLKRKIGGSEKHTGKIMASSCFDMTPTFPHNSLKTNLAPQVPRNLDRESISHTLIHCPYSLEVQTNIIADFGMQRMAPENLNSLYFRWRIRALKVERGKALWHLVPAAIYLVSVAGTELCTTRL